LTVFVNHTLRKKRKKGGRGKRGRERGKREERKKERKNERKKERKKESVR